MHIVREQAGALAVMPDRKVAASSSKAKQIGKCRQFARPAKGIDIRMMTPSGLHS